MIAQAEHIPVHLGAMPDAVAAVPRARPAPGRGLRPQRPVHGRHAPARHHARRGRRRPRLRRARGPTTPTSAGCSRPACPPGATRADPGGSGDPAGSADRRRAARPRRQHAQAGRAAGRPARPGGVPWRSARAAARAGRAARATDAPGAGWTSFIATASAASGRRSPRSPTAAYERRGRDRGRRHPHRATSRSGAT